MWYSKRVTLPGINRNLNFGPSISNSNNVTYKHQVSIIMLTYSTPRITVTILGKYLLWMVAWTALEITVRNLKQLIWIPSIIMVLGKVVSKAGKFIRHTDSVGELRILIGETSLATISLGSSKQLVSWQVLASLLIAHRWGRNRLNLQ